MSVMAETREMARALEREFAVELQSERIALPSRNDAVPAIDHTKRSTGDRRSLVDIPAEPWFWSRARPLALAAAVALLAILGAIVFGNFKSRQDSSTPSSGRLSEIEAEEERRFDEVLIRINAVGIDALSADERALLHRVSARYRGRLQS